MTFTMAVDRNYQKDKNNKKTDFINCELIGKHTENLYKYVSKGKSILVEGELNIEQYEKDGERRARFFNRRGTYFLDRLPGLWVTVWNKVYKAELFKAIRFNEHMKYGEDETINLMMLGIARRIYCSERFAVVHHKDNPNSLSKMATLDDLMEEQLMLIDLIRCSAEDQELCEAIRQRQEVLWSCPAYKRIFSEVPK